MGFPSRARQEAVFIDYENALLPLWRDDFRLKVFGAKHFYKPGVKI
jgi:hypothetical protein